MGAELVELVTKLLGVTSGLVALFVAIAGLTTGSRRRRMEAYYRAAADDERSRSPEREAILRSLQREAVGWSIADRAVPRAQLVIPLAVYGFATALQFFSGRFLGQNLAAGKRVWFGPWDLASPESQIGGLLWSTFLGLGLLLPMAPWIGHYFSERRRIATNYLMGVQILTHRPFWGRPSAVTAAALRAVHAEAVSRAVAAEAVLRAAGAEAVSPSTPTQPAPRFFQLRVAVALVGSAALAIQFGLSSVRSQAVITQAGSWVALSALLGAVGLTAGMSLLGGALVERTFLEWRHPAISGLSPDVPRRRYRPRLTPPRRVPPMRRRRT